MTNQATTAPEETYDLQHLAILLLKGVIYRVDNPRLWSTLVNLHSRVRDYFSVLRLSLMLDEAEGYAFLRSEAERDVTDEKLPRLIARRQLSFAVSLLLALLRRKMAEFDAGGGDTRLVLSRDEIVEIMRVFLLESTNDSKLVDQIDAHINKVVELGFLRRLKPSGASVSEHIPEYEVMRILKAFVDAEWLGEFDRRLDSFRRLLAGAHEEAADE